MSADLGATFPGLIQSDYVVTSPRSKRHNCIAWAAGDNAKWWWPGPNVDEEYWPPGVPRVESLDAFRQVFVSLGYTICQMENLEENVEKIALFADQNNNPKHAARQLPNGRWTSKLGVLEDIEHALRDLEGTAYGTVVLVMKRSI